MYLRLFYVKGIGEKFKNVPTQLPAHKERTLLPPSLHFLETKRRKVIGIQTPSSSSSSSQDRTPTATRGGGGGGGCCFRLSSLFPSPPPGLCILRSTLGWGNEEEEEAASSSSPPKMLVGHARDLTRKKMLLSYSQTFFFCQDLLSTFSPFPKWKLLLLLSFGMKAFVFPLFCCFLTSPL